ncbi:hypothetical protein E1B28_013066 [Marasmius oreades]|uniref:Uncharacterized protein n=1 Tax=Marasmius oreades TaxID=181124 RepID=A0A9P7RNZ8_9AGAR|nr:uncharacterized protein E1B28_013066 [Marasmius oreades]KAG7087084.1 hypothetical protein E1B28_013066 [Marasmius oreades]
MGRAKEVQKVQLQEQSNLIIKDANKMFSDFRKFVRDAPHIYAEDLYNHYFQPLPDGSHLLPTFFEEKIDILQEWHDFFTHCWDSVYRAEGAVEELQALHTMKVEVSAVISYVEELQCMATMGDNALKEAYARKELWFQR